MFKKKKCAKCKEKVSDKFKYCPSCGSVVNPNAEEERWGMLGKDDRVAEEENQDIFQSSLFGGFSGKMFNKMLGSAMKMLEKEMQKGFMEERLEKEMPLRTNFELYINGKKVNPEKIKVMKKPVNTPQKELPKKTMHKNIFSQESLEKFSKLPKEEPKTNIRRLSNKVVYEIDVPGVESINDIAIVKLESSIEVKAIGKTKAYKKVIPLDLPLKRYKLDKDKLILELGVKN